MDGPIVVQKASGDSQEYSPRKLERYLLHIGVSEVEAAQIVKLTEAELGEQTSTHKIAQVVTKHLQDLPRGELYSARYNLKPALRKLGPGGHIFEQYVGRLFQEEGFEVEVGVQLLGKCVTHEVDAVIRRGEELQMVESKFHNREGTKSDVTVVMYTNARFQDLRNRDPNFSNVWLVTNTKPSTDALAYAACEGMKVLTVELPENDSIMDKVIKYNLFPIGTIDHLDTYLEQLYAHNYVLLRDLLELTAEEAQRFSISPELLAQSQEAARRILM